MAPGFRMLLSKIGPSAALAFAGTALLLLAVGPLGWRLGWWQYGFALYRLMPLSGFVAAVGVALSALTLALGWSQLRLRGLIMLSVALVLGAALAYLPWQYSRVRASLPSIHDITTDTDNPPAFSAVLPARAAEHAGNVDYRDPQLPQLQKTAYPDVVPLLTALPVSKSVSRGSRRCALNAWVDDCCR